MACIGCEEYAKRVTNAYRDEEIRDAFRMLTGFEILCDSFICDACNTTLQQALKFKENCTRIYRKNNPTAKSSPMSSASTKPVSFHSTAIEEKEYFILETTNEEDVLLQDDDEDETLGENRYVHIDQTTTTDDGQYSIYQLEETPKAVRKIKSPKKEQPRRSRSSLKRTHAAAASSTLNSSNDDVTQMRDVSGSGARKSYSLQQKLEIIDYSEKHSNREASRHYDLNESTVRSFRRQKESLLKMSPTKSTNRRGTPYWPDLEVKLKEWTVQQKKRPKINEIKNQAIKIASDLGCTKFNGTTSWTFKFMQRHNINSSQPRPRKQHPRETDDEDAN